MKPIGLLFVKDCLAPFPDIVKMQNIIQHLNGDAISNPLIQIHFLE